MDVYRCMWFILACFPLKEINCVLETDEYDIVNSLLFGYNTNVRPVEHGLQPVVVHMDLHIGQLINLDTRNQILTTKIWIRLYWADANLRWNVSHHGGVNDIRILARHIWLPDIRLYNEVGHGFPPEDIFPAKVFWNGSVSWMYPTVIRSTCDLDVTYFPWDQQKCDLMFGSWTLTAEKMELFSISESGDHAHLRESSEFEVIGIPVNERRVLYACCPHPFHEVTFWVVFRRKPLYYIWTLILPTCFIAALSVLVFYLPVDSGEKVSLGITVLLTLSVVLIMVAEALPPQSVSVPIIAQFFAANILLLAASTSITIVVCNLYHRGSLGYGIPHWMKVFFLDWLARVIFMKATVVQNISSKYDIFEDKKGTQIQKAQPQTDRDADNPSTSVDKDKNHININYSEMHKKEWMLVAIVLDRFMMIVFFFLTVFVPLVILLNKPCFTDKDALNID